MKKRFVVQWIHKNAFWKSASALKGQSAGAPYCFHRTCFRKHQEIEEKNTKKLNWIGGEATSVCRWISSDLKIRKRRKKNSCIVQFFLYDLPFLPFLDSFVGFSSFFSFLDLTSYKSREVKEEETIEDDVKWAWNAITSRFSTSFE